MARTKAKVTPDLLMWAREDAGFALDEAARRLRVKTESLESWETGADRPSIPQLRRVAELYRRPLALFYMKERPEGFMVIHDFRRLPGEVAGVHPPELKIELRRAQERRRTAIDLAAEIESELKSFALTCSVSEPHEGVANRIREALSVSLDEQSQWRDPYLGFRAWRRKIEEYGVLVFQIPGFPMEVARGFSVAEDILPVVAVNRKDSWTGRSFTLLHEFTHLMLHQSGICDLEDDAPRPAEENRVEVFCNAVAGAALIPTESLLAHGTVRTHPQRNLEWTDEEIATLATSFSCSREAVLRRLLTLNRTSRNFYELKRKAYEDERKQSLIKKAKAKKPMKRNIPGETVSAIGRPFISLALETYHQQRITLNDLSEILGVKTRHIPKIESRLAVPLE